MVIPGTKVRIHTGIICILVLTLFMVSGVHASEEYGIFIVTDSQRNREHEIAGKMREYFLTIRESNPMLDKDSLPLRFCDYGNPSFAPYCSEVLRIPREYVPFIGIAVIDSEKNFVRFVEGRNLSRVQNSRTALEEIMKQYGSMLPESQRKGYRHALFTGIEEMVTNPPGASVSLNGREVGVTPIKSLSLDEGLYQVVISREGFEDRKLSFELSYGNARKFSEVLKQLTGNLILHSNPSGAEVFVNGKSHGKTPVTLSNIPVGEYSLRFTRPMYKEQGSKVHVRREETVTETVSLKKAFVSYAFKGKSNTVEISVQNKLTHRLETRSFKVDERQLGKRIDAMLGKSGILVPAGVGEREEITIEYEVTPTQEFKGEIVVRDNNSGEIILRESGSDVRPPLVDAGKLLDISVRMFEKTMPRFLEAVKKRYDL